MLIMEKAWVNKSNSFKEADSFDKKYYSNMSGVKRLEIVYLLRETYFKIKGQTGHEDRKRLRRSFKII